mgnify:CR=1 FL=1
MSDTLENAAATPSAAGSGPEMEKAYNPADHEPRAWRKWLDAKAFHADPERVLRGEARPYSVLIPPPNVTAALHLGHALNNTLQDVLVRAHRMMGCEALWMPGTDHAGIATQTVVEKRVQKEEGKRRTDFPREEFVAKIQAFKDEYEAVITGQLQKMGCSCDWDRQRFTMDPVCARAVREAFFQLFKAGLIYRGKRLVNWDPVTQTALADDEVEMVEVDGAFYYLRYPLKRPADAGASEQPVDAAPEYTHVTWGELVARGYPGADRYPADDPAWVTVATTRPETYLGDTAVAVNPKDPRAKALHGFVCELPLVGRIVPIIEDEYVVMPARIEGVDDAVLAAAAGRETEDGEEAKLDPKALFATGFLKVTPAHDPNDYELGQRHRETIERVCSAKTHLINVMAPDATISASHGWPDYDPHGGAAVFVGKSREEARRLVVAEFRARTAGDSTHSLLEDVKPHRHSVGHSYRSHAAIEPYLSDQWYCKVTDDRLVGFAQRALRADQRTSASHLPQSSRAAEQRNSDQSAGDGSMTFYPSRYARTYETWHDNLRDWCISRQLWWGHRIPVWSGSLVGRDDRIDEVETRLAHFWREGRLTSGLTIDPEDDAPALSADGRPLIGSELAFCVRSEDDREVVDFLEGIGLRQDPDVLDTWFSSALWPLSTMGWPDAEQAAKDTGIADFPALLDAFNPTSVLCTAREIITLWVSRMVMFNRFFRGNGQSATGNGEKETERQPGPAPFRDVFIHAMIQDGEGRKMSKSLGNGVDPLDIIDSHGADAMRFTLVQMTTQTQDVRMPVEPDPRTGKNTSPKFDIGRNFCNKLWNAARFAIMTLQRTGSVGDRTGPDGGAAAHQPTALIDRWMLSRLAAAIASAEDALKNYQFSGYAQTMYDVFWRDFCDWYLEGIKPTVQGDPAQQATLRGTLDAFLRLLHPITPFITEAVFERLNAIPGGGAGVAGLTLAAPRKGGTLATAGWPVAEGLADPEAERRFERVRSLVESIRQVRAQHQVKPARRVTLHGTPDLAALLADAGGLVETLAGLEGFTAEEPKGASASFTFEGREHRLSNLADAVDAAAEQERLRKEEARIRASIDNLTKRLANRAYIEKAPEKLVNQTREELEKAKRDLEAVLRALEGLG